MGVKGFLNPTKGKIATLIFMAIIFFLIYYFRMSGYGADPYASMDLPVMIFVFLSFPLVIFSRSFLLYPSSIFVFIYWYILACVYVTAYHWLDSNLRKKYPQINARWENNEGK